MRMLFVSFTSTLYALKTGSVTEVDLASGIFFFGCGREHAFDPWSGDPASNEVEWHFEDDLEKGREVHKAFVSALVQAEVDGRVHWHKSERTSYDELNALLEKNGVGKVATGSIDDSHYNYPTVVQKVKEAELPLHVVFDS